jgi:hypothetical protein
LGDARTLLVQANRGDIDEPAARRTPWQLVEGSGGTPTS